MWIRQKNKKYLIDSRIEDYVKFYSIAQIFTHTVSYKLNGIVKLDHRNFYFPLILQDFI